jgi:hypothetical protein
MKIQDKLDEVMAFVESARGLPMSSSVVVNKAELARLLDELRELLPDDLLEAQVVLDRREHILTEAVANAERLLVAAEEEKQRLVSEEEVLRQARIEAGTVLQSARAESEHMAREIDGYVDAKLANLEVSITKLLDTVRQGRDHLAQPGLYNDLAAADVLETAVPDVVENGYERPQLDHRPAPPDDERAAPFASGHQQGWVGAQPEQSGYPPVSSGFEPYEAASPNYDGGRYEPQAYQAEVPTREPDPLTDDIWITPAALVEQAVPEHDSGSVQAVSDPADSQPESESVASGDVADVAEPDTEPDGQEQPTDETPDGAPTTDGSVANGADDAADPGEPPAESADEPANEPEQPEQDGPAAKARRPVKRR